MSTPLRCGSCNHWLGESVEPLAFVECVKNGMDATIAPPRDLRLCKSCLRVSVFIPRRDLDIIREHALSSSRT
jgi:hypothetical protein